MSQTIIRSIRDLEIKNRRLFLRLDFNVPLSSDAPSIEGEEPRILPTVLDDTRIQEALPTIQFAIEAGAKILIASHLGRPHGNKNPAYSLEPVALHLANLLNCEVRLADDCVGDGIELLSQSMKAGSILMLENLRFYSGEEKNDPDFCHQLGRLTDVYVTDAFGTSHRKHASTYGLPQIIEETGMGFLIEKELKFLNQLLNNPQKPFMAVLGGAKVSDKIKTIESLIHRVKAIAIGGAMAYAFMTVKGKPLPEGAKKPSSEDINSARNILNEAERRDVIIELPTDTIDSFDIGPNTLKAFKNLLSSAKTVFWNGPLGWFEKPEYAVGTQSMIEFLAGLEALKVVGGGETVSAVKHSEFADKFDHLSTGGGAVLEYLEGNGLPGIQILETEIRS